MQSMRSIIFFILILFWTQAQNPILVLTESPQFLNQIKDIKIRYTYLIIAPQAFLDTCLPLAKMRGENGHSVVCVTTEAIWTHFSKNENGIFSFVQYAHQNWPAPKLQFLLLAADVSARDGVPGIPTFFIKDYQDLSFATDHLYGQVDSSHPILVGRLPAKTKQELQTMVKKIVDFEKSGPGLWQRKISFVAGQGGYGQFSDALLEDIFKKLLSSYLPHWADVNVLYGNPNSIYFFPTNLFPQMVVNQLNQGGLFFVYIGHGAKTSLGHIYFQRQYYDIFSTSDVKKVNINKGMPIAVCIACNTGKFGENERDWEDNQEDCLGESLIKKQHGPVAFIGASRISHPYGNVLVGKFFLEAAFQKKLPTIGQALAYVQQQLLNPPAFDFQQAFLNLAAKTFVNQDLPLKQLRQDHVYMYNLLGDPATRLAIPDQTLTFEVQPEKNGVVVKGNAPFSHYEIIATLEVPLDSMIPQNFFSADDFIESKWRARNDFSTIQKYFYSNHKILCKTHTTQNESSFCLFLIPSKPYSSGKYWVKVALIAKDKIITGCQVFQK